MQETHDREWHSAERHGKYLGRPVFSSGQGMADEHEHKLI